MASKRERGKLCKRPTGVQTTNNYETLLLFQMAVIIFTFICSLHNAFHISYMTLKPKANCYVLGIVCITKECELFWEDHVSENNILLY